MRARAVISIVAVLAASAVPAGSTGASDASPLAVSVTTLAPRLIGELSSAGGSPQRITRHIGSQYLSFVGGSPEHGLTPPSGDDASETARAFVDRYGPAFGVAAPATALAEDRRAEGQVGEVVRFRQQVGGVPVLAAELAVQVGADGAVTSASGEVTDADRVDLERRITPADAAATSITATSKWASVDPVSLVATTPEPLIYDPALVGAPDVGSPRLVWKVVVTATDGAVRRVVLIDAGSGAVAFSFDDIQAGLARSICSNGDLAGAPESCTAPVRNEGDAPIVDADPDAVDVNAAYDMIGVFHAFYLGRFGRDSVDGAGLPLKATVRYCPGSGSCPFRNAFWNGEQMVIGSGYAVADDVVGHELTHGVTQYTSQLLYYSESGAINESMSDVMGELIDLASTVSGPDAPGDRWKIGEQVRPGGIRNMADPTAGGQPDRMTSSFYSGSPLDDYGVHRNSGVGNKAATLIADGGSFNGQSIIGVGLETTAQIYYQAETTLLGPGSDYRDLYDILPQACRALLGTRTTVVDCEQVTKAVSATEMNLAPTTAGARRTAAVCDVGTHESTTLLRTDMEADTGLFTSTAAPAAAAWRFVHGSSQSGSRSLYAPDLDVVASASASLVSSVAIPSLMNTYLRFEHSYSFEQGNGVGYDGGVVEYRAGGVGAPWLDAGTLPGTVNGYNATLATGGDNPLEGRRAFTGESPGYQQTRVDLTSLAGQSVLVRFSVGSDRAVGADGWFVDDVSIYTCMPDGQQAQLGSINGPAGATRPARRL